MTEIEQQYQACINDVERKLRDEISAEIGLSDSNALVSADDDTKPWDVKVLKLSLGGLDDSAGWIRFEVFNDDSFNIYINETATKETDWHAEDIDMSAARRLRDFLNYAVR